MITPQSMLFAPMLTLEQKRNSPPAVSMNHAVKTSPYAFALLRRGAITIPILALLIAMLTACGGGDDTVPPPVSTPIVAPTPTPPSLALMAGHLSGTAASFYAPRGIATDNAGNVYVADTYNHTIRKITPAGVVTTLAGSGGNAGSVDGTGAAARFTNPASVATDSANNVYVADSSNHIIRKITPAGVVTTLAGTAGIAGSADGTGAAASFAYPQGITTDGANNVYVADYNSHTIRKITPTGVVTTFAGTAGSFGGSADGTGAAAGFYYPTGITTDSADNVYVADTRNTTIRKITPAGVVTTFAGTAGNFGSADGTGAAARFNNPQGITTDGADNVYVTDALSHTIRKITPAGVVTTLAGTAGSFGGSTDGTGAEASIYLPQGISTDGAGNVYVADTFNHTIRKITPDGVVTTLAGVAGGLGSADGTSAAVRLNNPQGITTDSTGNTYVADSNSNTIRKITPAGEITVLAGALGAFGSSVDGTGAAARFNNPQGIATDSTDNIYVADTWNHTIRKITPEGVVTTFAGTAGVWGNAGGTGAEARFTNPRGIAIDGINNIYVADTSNSTIRKITPAGVVTTLAGSAAIFTSPAGITTDNRGNVYVADTSSNTIRKITPAGVVTTLAGASFSSGSADGTGTAARFNNPTGIATDYRHNIYVADTGNNTIRKITPAGVVTTLVGTVGQIHFAAGALPGAISSPQHVAIRGTSLYITMGNAVVVVRDLP